MKKFLLSLLTLIVTTIYADESLFHLSAFSLRNLEILQNDYPEYYQQTCDEVEFFRRCFERSAPLLEGPKRDPLIPRELHFIWLGGKNLPDESILHSWKKYNPHYTIYLWTDRPRTLQASYIIQRDIKELFPFKMEKEYSEANNWGEKSDIIRYEILERMGGIYADIDIECIRSFDDLTANATFFVSSADVCPMMGHNIHVINSIIGSVKKHPIVMRTIERIQEEWDSKTKEITKIGFCDFHPEKTHSVLLCFARTYIPLTESILEVGLAERDFVFPVHYFNYQGDPAAKPVYVLNHSFKSWFPETPQIPVCYQNEKTKKMLSKCYKLSYKFLGLSALVCVISALLVLYAVIQRKFQQAKEKI